MILYQSGLTAWVIAIIYVAAIFLLKCNPCSLSTNKVILLLFIITINQEPILLIKYFVNLYEAILRAA